MPVLSALSRSRSVWTRWYIPLFLALSRWRPAWTTQQVSGLPGYSETLAQILAPTQVYNLTLLKGCNPVRMQNWVNINTNFMNMTREILFLY